MFTLLVRRPIRSIVLNAQARRPRVPTAVDAEDNILFTLTEASNPEDISSGWDLVPYSCWTRWHCDISQQVPDDVTTTLKAAMTGHTSWH